ncbi:alpha/beta hydrolase [Pseudotabrizicola alkalilacus]|uniref:Alpha/beta hydrolase n=1 Tax=Pseudotabrizicola alkalilacus TaxID=2305252 RepID=A0A411Z0Z8_9RHOB|nr:alpha/beta hydrolase [Pseudotabrizicola alkalilacus]RGP36755.1 alpha/beta hydrolase [Pseudotabrizicola alkalilacus]
MDFATEADRAYANGAFIPGAAEFVPRWRAKAAAFRAQARGELGLAYGPGARQRLDLFLPDGAARGVMLFVHGGYWMDFGREDWSHLAAGAVARGWACAVPSYTLAPEARISAMTLEIAAAVRAVAARVPGPVVVAGHSAGGHLAARMACADGPEVARVVPISPLVDLRPLMETQMNTTLRLDAAAAAAESPALLRPRAGVQAHVWVGGQERPAFLWQARLLAEAWACPWTVDAGRHHFDVIDGLADPASPLMEACLGGL